MFIFAFQGYLEHAFPKVWAHADVPDTCTTCACRGHQTQSICLVTQPIPAMVLRSHSTQPAAAAGCGD